MPATVAPSAHTYHCASRRGPRLCVYYVNQKAGLSSAVSKRLCKPNPWKPVFVFSDFQNTNQTPTLVGIQKNYKDKFQKIHPDFCRAITIYSRPNLATGQLSARKCLRRNRPSGLRYALPRWVRPISLPAHPPAALPEHGWPTESQPLNWADHPSPTHPP